MIKPLKKLGIEGTLLSIIKTIYGKPTAKIILNRENPKSFPLIVRNDTSVSTIPTLIQYSTRIPDQRNKTGERNKKDSNREGKSQIIPIFQIL
jgi:hypothetical protein